jgi:mannose-6-phosphate isomerase-like protein (cupin superfamily)
MSPVRETPRHGHLVHRDGHRVTFLEEGRDGRGEYLIIEHMWTRPGAMAGPHWHPVLAETFRVREGRMRFRVDGREFVLGPGEGVTVRPGEVHRFWNEGEGRLKVVHEVRPPGRHRQMFELWHRLDVAGRTNRQGVPKNPLALGLLWELQDGYLAGVPAFFQRLLFGGSVAWPASQATKHGWRSSRPTGLEGSGRGRLAKGHAPRFCRWAGTPTRGTIGHQGASETGDRSARGRTGRLWAAKVQDSRGETRCKVLCGQRRVPPIDR